QSNFIRRVLSAQPHIQLLPPKEVSRPQRETGTDGAVEHGALVQPPLQRLRSIDQWQAIATPIRGMREVEVVSPEATGSALAVRGSASRAISAIGIEPDRYFRIVDIPGKIVEGSTRLGATDILIGAELASD